MLLREFFVELAVPTRRILAQQLLCCALATLTAAAGLPLGGRAQVWKQPAALSLTLDKQV